MKLAVIGTFYKKYESSRTAIRAVLDSSRPPDEFWILCETDEDAENALAAISDDNQVPVHLIVLPTPRDAQGNYAVIPYSNKINHALDHSHAEVFVYLDNGSVPHRDKYLMMEYALKMLPSVGAVYCTQHRTGYQDVVSLAREVVPDAFCRLNFTQVMHRKTDARWTLDMQHALPNDLADALFWRSLHERLGAFYPVETEEILDEHHIPSPAANGL